MKIGLSIIFPVFNEEYRLDGSLDLIKKFLINNKQFDLELIIIDDGSTDNTGIKINEFLKLNKGINIKYLKSLENKGKGNALKLGVIEATKKWILTSDIDLSVKLEQINIWFEKYKINENKYKVFFGSRNLSDSQVEKKIHRYFLGVIFNILIKILFKVNIKDSQCGFKLYEGRVAKKIFANLETLGFAHDIELINKINNQNIEIRELPVKWRHMPNSKLNIVIDPIKMLFEKIKIFIKSKKND